MSRVPSGFPCQCSCHGNVTIHVTLTCDCGKPITPPHGGECPPKRPKCPPPEVSTQPGTVTIQQQNPPPSIISSTIPSWTVGKPTAGSAGEIPWFTNQIGQVLRNGPQFGPRKDEYLPYLLIRASSGRDGLNCDSRAASGTFPQIVKKGRFRTPSES